MDDILFSNAAQVLAAVLRQSRDSIYMLDREGKIVFWNEGARQMYGYTEAEARGMTIWNIIPQHLQKSSGEMILNMLQGDKIEWLETQRVAKDERLLNVLFSASPVPDPGTGNTSTVVITERDVTQAVAADEKAGEQNATPRHLLLLEAANADLESFSYSVSHDLRAPLRALNGNVQILQEDHYDKLDDDAKKVLDKIRMNSARLGQLINDLVSFYRMGKKEVRRSRVDMEEMVRKIFSEITGKGSTRAEIVIHALPEAYGDYSMLNLVWTNLISNALKFSSKTECPRIDVGASQDAGVAEYYIKDNGVGFDMAYAGKLFGTFQRLHDSTEFEGTGIGLAVAHRIVRKHGGTIRVYAEPEKGATFWVAVPAAGDGV